MKHAQLTDDMKHAINCAKASTNCNFVIKHWQQLDVETHKKGLVITAHTKSQNKEDFNKADFTVLAPNNTVFVSTIPNGAEEGAEAERRRKCRGGGQTRSDTLLCPIQTEQKQQIAMCYKKNCFTFRAENAAGHVHATCRKGQWEEQSIKGSGTLNWVCR